MHLKSICALILTLTFSVSFAQQKTKITGRIIDAESRLPLIEATLVVEGEENQGIATNNKGEFVLNNVTVGSKMTASYMGYEHKIVIAKNNFMVIELAPISTILGEVAIVGKSELRELKESAMPVSVINIQQLTGTVSDVNDVLARTVGVTIRNTGGLGSSSRISVRGLEGKRIGVFIDEYPMNDNSDFISLNDIPIEMIERIEIYKGVVPARFGGSSIGGAVNIVIRDYPPKYLDANYTVGSYNTHRASLVVKRNIKDKGIEIGGGGFYDYSDNNYTMDSPYDKGLKIKRDHDKYQKLTAALTTTLRDYYFDEIDAELVYINTKKELQGIEYNIQHAHSFSDVFLFAPGVKKDDFLLPGLDLDFGIAAAYTDYHFIDNADHRTNWDGSHYNPVSAYGGETNKWASDYNQGKFTASNTLNLEYLISKNHSLNINSVFSYVKGEAKDELKKKTLGYETNFPTRMNSWIFGVCYDYKDNNDRFLNSLNVKYYNYQMKTKLSTITNTIIKDIDMKKNDYGIINAMRYRITPTLMAKFSAGYDVRLPAENELLGDGYIVAPAGSLVPERNTSFNLGFLYDLMGKHKSNLQIELSAYYMYLEDMIRISAGALQSQYQNFGEMETRGIEVEVKADVTNYLYAYVNATYQDLRDARKYEYGSTNLNPTEGMRMPNTPYLMANAGVEFHKENLFGGEKMNTRISLDGSFIEEYFYGFEMSKFQERRIPRSLSFDAGLEQSFCDGRYFIIATLYNATNQKILNEFNRPLPGRNFNIRLRYVFK